MTRIMAWNIERFGNSKLNPGQWDPTGQRLRLIMDTIVLVNPDILIIIEVQTEQNGFGNLISGPSGYPAVVRILDRLNLLLPLLPPAQWWAVPPLITSVSPGYSEAVAVLFNGATLSFWGPNVWDGATSQPLPLIPPVVPGAYPGWFAGWLSNAASTGWPPPPAAPLPEDRLAGRCQFFNGAGVAVRFPDPNSRSLWRTQFGVKGTPRFINLYAVHFPPKPYRSMPAFANLLAIPEISGALGPNEDRIVLGDFNINSLNLAQSGVFGVLTGAALPLTVYAQQFNQPTAIKSVNSSSTTPGPPLWPNFYNYGTKDTAGNLLGLDNMFIARGGGGGVAAPANATVVNPVIGGMIGGAPPTNYQSAMLSNIATINGPPPGGSPPGGPRAKRFRNPLNYGHIGGGRGASDHLPIVVDLP